MTKIEWTEETWNPVVGCTRVPNPAGGASGCDHCYAVTMSHRLEAMGQERYAGLTVLNNRGDRHFNGDVRTVPEVLEKPLKWRKPRTVFVNSMGDLFHPAVPFAFIDDVWGVMRSTPQHTYQILTKRPERMAAYFDDVRMDANESFGGEWVEVPLPNVWLGTSCENQAAADARIPHLLRCPAAVRFLSCEPLLGGIDLTQIDTHSKWPGRSETSKLNALRGFTASRRDEPNPVTMTRSGEFIEHERSRFVDTEGPGVDWVIVGGESGKGARACDVAWIRSIVGQCRDAGVACFVKQLGANVRDRNDAGFDGDPDDAWDYAKIVDVEHHPDGDTTVYQGAPVRVRLHSRKGGDPAEWPEDLRVREMPVGWAMGNGE